MYYIHTLEPSDWKGYDQFLSGPLMQQMLKALEAGTGVDAADFTGGRALQYESLDNVLQSVTLSEEDCTLWRALPKKTIRATVDQYNRRTSLGSRWGMAVGESESPTDQLSEIARAFAEVKFYRSRREVSDIALLVNMTEDPEAWRRPRAPRCWCTPLTRTCTTANRRPCRTGSRASFPGSTTARTTAAP